MGKGKGETNTPNLEDLLRMGINTAKQGNKEGARVIFKQVLDNDKRNERAWLWLASVVDDTKEQRRILQTVLALNPRNASAQRLLNAMDQRVQRTERNSMRIGITILVALIILLVVVTAIVFLVTRV